MQNQKRFLGRYATAACAIATVVVLVGTSGCLLPRTMRVDRGSIPEFQDDLVAFRTTYYFRVFDQCGGRRLADMCEVAQAECEAKAEACSGAASGCAQLADECRDAYEVCLLPASPSGDALYRFTMTGKASPWDNIHFESGTLHKDEIDPFGAGIERDSETGRFYHVTQRENKARADYNATYEELNRLFAELKKFDSDQEPSEAVTTAKTTLTKLINKKYEALIATTVREESEREQADQLGVCAEGASRQGFQILGPEGWRTFDQDERLILAMTANAEPLISTLRELSSRVTNARATDEASVVPLLTEQNRILRAQRLLDRDVAAENVVSTLHNVAKELGDEQ